MKKQRSSGADAAEPSYKPRKPSEERLSGPFDEWEIRDALRTIVQARKIQKNKALMRAIRTEAKKQLAAAQATQQLTGA